MKYGQTQGAKRLKRVKLLTENDKTVNGTARVSTSLSQLSSTTESFAAKATLWVGRANSGMVVLRCTKGRWSLAAGVKKWEKRGTSLCTALFALRQLQQSIDQSVD